MENMINMKKAGMKVIETNKLTKGVIKALNYYFCNEKTARMTDEEYKQFLHDIEKAYFYIKEFKEYYLG